MDDASVFSRVMAGRFEWFRRFEKAFGLVLCASIAASAALLPASLVVTPAEGGTHRGANGMRRDPSLPRPLRILSASIEEPGPIDLQNVVGRSVVLSLEVYGARLCTAGGRSASCGFMIDSDRNASTKGGSVPPAVFLPLGIDARVSADCDDGTFSSAVGAVTASTARPGRFPVTRLEISTTVEMLPSVSFHWIAYCIENDRLTRLPPAPETEPDDDLSPHDVERLTGAASWATFEISKF